MTFSVNLMQDMKSNFLGGFGLWNSLRIYIYSWKWREISFFFFYSGIWAWKMSECSEMEATRHEFHWLQTTSGQRMWRGVRGLYQFVEWLSFHCLVLLIIKTCLKFSKFTLECLYNYQGMFKKITCILILPIALKSTYLVLWVHVWWNL